MVLLYAEREVTRHEQYPTACAANVWSARRARCHVSPAATEENEPHCLDTGWPWRLFCTRHPCRRGRRLFPGTQSEAGWIRSGIDEEKSRAGHSKGDGCTQSEY